jgi:hypothetical protein
VEAEAPNNMPLPLLLCFKVGEQILADFCYLEVISFRFCSCLSGFCPNYSCFFFNNDVKYYIMNYIITFQKEEVELEADPEAEALPEAPTFCWKRKRWKRKRKRSGWKRKHQQF